MFGVFGKSVVASCLVLLFCSCLVASCFVAVSCVRSGCLSFVAVVVLWLSFDLVSYKLFCGCCLTICI